MATSFGILIKIVKFHLMISQYLMMQKTCTITLGLFFICLIQGFEALRSDYASPSTRCETSLRVMTFNVWMASWFKDKPIPSEEEPYSVELLKEEFRSEGMNRPSPFLKLLDEYSDELILSVSHPSLENESRLKALCQYLRSSDLDVVFLQEVWYKKYYDFIYNCLHKKFYISQYEPACSDETKVTFINCTGLITLSRFSFQSRETFQLPQHGPDSELIFQFYYQDFAKIKALVHRIIVQGCRVALANTHFSSYVNDQHENRGIRTKQAKNLIEALGDHWDFVVVGLDMNDSPGTDGPYSIFLQNGFQDAAYSDQTDPNSKVLERTYGNLQNTWSGNVEDSVTIDYILTKVGAPGSRLLIDVEDFRVVDLKTEDVCNCSISDHSAVTAVIATKLA